MVLNQRTVVGIMGSGKRAWAEYSIPLARWIAEQNYHLLTGGGGGVMAAASKAFCEVENRAGICIGIVPTELNDRGKFCLLYTSPSPRDLSTSRMPSSA